MLIFPNKHGSTISFFKSCSVMSSGNANTYPVVPNSSD